MKKLNQINQILIASIILLSITSFAMAQTTNISIPIYDNALTPSIVPFPVDNSTWQPLAPYVYTATVHGAINEAAIAEGLNYTNANNTTSFDDQTGWNITKNNNSASLSDSVSANDVINLTKGNTTFSISVTTTNASLVTDSYPNARKVNLQELIATDNLQPGGINDRITSSTSGNATEFNIDLPYQNGTIHTFENVPITSGLGVLIAGSKDSSTSNLSYTYNLSAGYDYYTNTSYVWLVDINDINRPWYQTGYGWLITTQNNSTASHDITSNTLENFTVPMNGSLNFFMCPSSLGGNDLPSSYMGENWTDSWGTSYYPNSSVCHIHIHGL